MKPIVITACLLLVTLSLLAAQPQQQPKDDTKTQSTTHTETVLSTAATVGVGDSPLVRAAKSSHRPGKKVSSTVITNETLVRTGGHFTTTTAEAQKELPAVKAGASSPWDQLAASAHKKAMDAEAAAAASADARRGEEQRQAAAAQHAALVGGDSQDGTWSYNEPPAMDGPMQPLKPTSPSSAGQSAKPPL